jgi:phosphatidylglycerophosphate synthase
MTTLPILTRPPARAAELTAGLVAAAALLGALSVAVGLDVAGWTAGGAVALAIVLLLDRGLRNSGAASLGPANTVTYARSLLVAAVTALAASPGHSSVIVMLTAVALALDAVDGAVARRTGSSSALGARFDMEVDAFLLLALCVVAARSVGGWVLAIGLLRYAFVAAGVLLPMLTAPLPPRTSRKVVAAAQGVVLLTAVSGVLPSGATVAALGAALAALCWSFGRDVVWLAAQRSSGAARAPDDVLRAVP